MRLSLRGLRTFCLSAKHLSFKRAADELCLTASAVSHQISDLETELDTRLFNRHTRSISLTEKGDQFYEEIALHLTAIQEAADRVTDRHVRTPLLVQTPEFFASELLMPLLGEFSSAHASIDLRIESKDKMSSPNPQADINIVLTRKRPVAAQVTQLFPIRYVPACSRELYLRWQGGGVSAVEAINVSTILLHKARPRAWNQWAEHAGIRNMKPKQVILVDSMFALARAAEQGAGIALVPMPVSKGWFESGALLPLHDASLVTEDFYWVCVSEDAMHHDAAETFRSWLLNNLPDHVRGMDEINSSVA